VILFFLFLEIVSDSLVKFFLIRRTTRLLGRKLLLLLLSLLLLYDLGQLLVVLDRQSLHCLLVNLHLGPSCKARHELLVFDS